jgi:hypothetical protein
LPVGCKTLAIFPPVKHHSALHPHHRST